MAGLKGIGRLPTIAQDTPNRPVKAPPATKVGGRPDTGFNRPTLFPEGPEFLGLATKRQRRGPGPEPAGFEGSLPEWVWYWASMRKLSPKQDPYRGPFVGAIDGSWAFTDPIGETQTARIVGATTPDFSYPQPQGLLIIRIEGFYWHTGSDPATQARDAYLASHAQNEGTRVERVEDGEYMDDATGEKAVALLAEILGGRSFVGAIHGGVTEPPRYATFE